MGKQFKGPFSYENWKAANGGAPVKEEEYSLFTDAYITGTIESECGPYKLLLLLGMDDAGTLAPRILLRVAVHADYEHPSLKRTNTALYHGGQLCDEVAALVSLSMGIRLKAGPRTREFLPGQDPKGRPEGPILRLNPTLSRQTAHKSLIPSSLGQHNLNSEIILLRRFPELAAKDAVAVVRAARSYQEAIWIADSDPEISWLMLVTAAEIAALHWDKARFSPIEKLTASHPDLVKSLKEKCGDDALQEVAKVFANHKGVLNKFLNFMIHFLPDPFPERADLERSWCSWRKSAMREYMKVIYDHRSKALHDGTPFPYPMCISPDFDPRAERHLAVACSAMGGSWTEKDTPMLLHTFEYIVRNALLKWWGELPAKDTS